MSSKGSKTETRIHCLKCKEKTETQSPSGHRTAKGGYMVKATCGKCGGKKCGMVSTGGGFFSDLFS